MSNNNNVDKWWTNWSPFWDKIENRHFSTYLIDKIIEYIKGKVLVIGAGQGLIVTYLKNKGYDCYGLDLNDEMIKYAKQRHNIDIIKGDANNLPFKDNEFDTVIISSGVLDYGADENSIKKMIDEALRVTKPNGYLFSSFYQLLPSIEKIYLKIGVIDKNKIYRMKRIFEIGEISSVDPLDCIPLIMKWTDKGFLRTLIEWTIIGLTLPKEIIKERELFNSILDQSETVGINKELLLSSIPEEIPYRTKKDIISLFNKLNIKYEALNKYNDCIIIRHKKNNY